MENVTELVSIYRKSDPNKIVIQTGYIGSIRKDKNFDEKTRKENIRDLLNLTSAFTNIKVKDLAFETNIIL